MTHNRKKHFWQQNEDLRKQVREASSRAEKSEWALAERDAMLNKMKAELDSKHCPYDNCWLHGPNAERLKLAEDNVKRLETLVETLADQLAIRRKE